MYNLPTKIPNTATMPQRAHGASPPRPPAQRSAHKHLNLRKVAFWLESGVKEARRSHRLCGQKVCARPDSGQDCIESELRRAHLGMEKGTVLRYLGRWADRYVKDGVAA